MNPKQKKKWKRAVARVIETRGKNPDEFDSQDWGLAMYIWKRIRESMEPYRMHTILSEKKFELRKGKV